MFEKKIAVLEQQLSDIESMELSPLLKIEQSYDQVEDSLEQLRSDFFNQELSQEDEINFFKKVKPFFLGAKIFYGELYKLEANQPYGNKKDFRRYYERKQKQVSKLINDNLSFYGYYKADKVEKDRKYFLRSASRAPLSGPYIDVDPFSTYHSTLLSMLCAYERILSYIEQKLSRQPIDQTANVIKSSLHWTGQKVKLIELGYALHAMGVCNDGKADIKQIMSALELVFNIKLGNYYSIFLKTIRLRKKNITIFLDELRDSLVQRMEDLDEHPRYQ